MADLTSCLPLGMLAGEDLRWICKEQYLEPSGTTVTRSSNNASLVFQAPKLFQLLENLCKSVPLTGVELWVDGQGNFPPGKTVSARSSIGTALVT